MEGTSVYHKLLGLGANVVKAPVIFPSRGKSFGRMWDGSAELELNGEHFNFELWYHGADEETLDTLLPHFSLKSISKSTRVGYDCNWHTVITPWGILYTPEGWFRNAELREKVGSYNNNIPDRITRSDVERLLSIGLEWLVQW